MSLITNRQLPQIRIAGIDFYVDAIARELIETADPRNRIHVLEMLTLEDHHEFLLDLQRKNIAAGHWNAGDNGQQKEYVWIRRMEALDPEGMKLLQEVGMVAKLPENLPVVYIGDTAFYWFEQQTAFCQVDNPWNRICKNDAVIVGGEQGFYFDSILKQVPFPHEIESYKGELPDHIYFKPVRPLFEIINSLNSNEKRTYEKPKPQQRKQTKRRIR